MPFPFIYVCDLLEQLSNISEHDPPHLAKEAEKRSADAIANWFGTHRTRIEAHDNDGIALLSALLPEKRTDKVYCMQAEKLEKCLGRALCLGPARMIDVRRWRDPGKGDLADCLERTLRLCENPRQPLANEVTTEDVERVTLAVASKKQFSSPAVKRAGNTSLDDSALLHPLCLRLQSREVKWLTRLIMKSYSPVVIPESLIYRCYHYLLPDLMKLQSEFTAALELLRREKLRGMPSMPPEAERALGKDDLMRGLLPKIGVKVGRGPFFKARSIKHCCTIARNRRMSIEEKHDGEYCQIHIDMTKDRRHWIQIFSKSGKDSTEDRVMVRNAIFTSLRLGQSDCKIAKKCILEGELVVYSDKEKRILDFHQIRKHVTRSGSKFASENDSPPNPWEHLMLVFFDIMLVDDTPVLHLNNCQRRQHLEEVIRIVPGYAELVSRKTICFSLPSAAEELRNAFATCITAQGEGLIMKPTDEPYFNFTDSFSDYRSCCIKLKMQYIGKFGDVGDFAVVGASYDAVRAKELRIPDVKWTTFWLGCLENKEEVCKWEEIKPRFKVVKTISPGRDIIEEMRYVDSRPVDFVDNHVIYLDVAKGIANGKNPTMVFTQPPVFDMRCFGFDKEGNTGFWTLRFPDVSKIHLDRTYKDTMGFNELQTMAIAARVCAEDDMDAKKDLEWITRLKQSDPRGIAVDAATPSTTRGTQSTDMVHTPCGRLESTASPLATRAGLVRANTTQQVVKVKIASNTDLNNVEGWKSYSLSSASALDSSSQTAESQVRTPLPGAMNPPPSSGWNIRVSTSPTSSATRVITPPKISKKRTLIDFQGTPLLKRRHVDGILGSERTDISSSRDQGNSPSRQSGGPLSNLTNLPQNIMNGRKLASPSRRSETSQAQKDFPSGRNSVRFDIFNDEENESFYAQQSPPAATIDEPPSPVQPKAQSQAPCLTPTLPAVQLEPSPQSISRTQLGPRPCELSLCHIYLSPCISGIPFLTDDLMRFHHAQYTTNLLDFCQAAGTVRDPGDVIRKLALVEIRRQDATVDIMKRIQDLKTHDGQAKTWVEVFDHRLLEWLWDNMRGKSSVDIPGIWRKCWITAV